MPAQRPLGVSTSLIASCLGGDWPETALATVAACGVGHVEYFCDEARFRDEGHIARLKQSAAHSAVGIWSVHAPFGTTDISQEDETGRAASVDNVIRALDVAIELGAGLVVTHASREPIGEDERPRRLIQCIRSLNELCKRASQRGVLLALETLPRTCLANRTDEMRRILDIVDGDLRVCYDVNHITLYEGVGESLRALGDRISTLHISDHDGVDERHWTPGRGIVDWAGFVDGLDAIGYRGCLLHEATDRELDLAGNLQAIVEAARRHLRWNA